MRLALWSVVVPAVLAAPAASQELLGEPSPEILTKIAGTYECHTGQMASRSPTGYPLDAEYNRTNPMARLVINEARVGAAIGAFWWDGKTGQWESEPIGELTIQDLYGDQNGWIVIFDGVGVADVPVDIYGRLVHVTLRSLGLPKEPMLTMASLMTQVGRVSVAAALCDKVEK